MSKDRIVIIGAGMAGATTAYFLARRGLNDILLLEKEKVAGAQSTGRNAAILRTMIPNPALNRIARQCAEFYYHPPEGFSSEPLVDPIGVCMTARAEHAATLKTWCDDNPEANLVRAEATRIYEQIPILAPGLVSIAFKPDDGVLDVHAILQAFIRGACHEGAELRFGCHFKNLEIRNGRIAGVETTDGFVEAAKVVVASGGWASVADTFKGYSLPFTPYRRHLLVTEPLPQVNPRWPVIWVVGDEFYFRPESGGLLMSGCDAVKVTVAQGETTDHAELERIAAKAARWLPSLADARVAKAWAGMRTFAPDDMFVIGADPRLQGLFWVAGLGGHGITCAPFIGNLAADWIAEGKSSNPAASIMAPDRLVK
jgi:glycine/D-amino acid oxidase-like deaminating enzyme